jgi:hypothetical protein
MNKYIPTVLKKVDKGLVLLLILPWLLLLNNDIWLFDFNVLIDAWLYLGFFLRFEQLLSVYGDTYYAGRLGWILPGHFIFEVFPPLVAQYILHIGFYYLAILSIYFLLKRIVDDRSALLASVMMGCHAWFLFAIGSNYVNGAGIAYFSAALLMLTLAATQKTHWKVFLSLAGAVYGLAIYSNLSWILLTPSLAFYYLLINRKHQKYSLVRSSALLLIGFFAITLLLGVINSSINGRFFFFLPSVNFVKYTNSYQQSPYKLSWSVWLPNALWLLLWITTFISAVALSLFSYIKKSPPLKSVFTSLQICLLLASLPFVGLQIGKEPMLQLYYYASYLMPLTFIAIGGQFYQLKPTLSHLKSYQFSCILSVIILVALIAYQLPTNLINIENKAIFLTLFSCVFWFIWLSAGLLDCLPTKRLLSNALFVFILTFNIINFTSIVYTTNSLKSLILSINGDLRAIESIPKNLLSEINYSQRRDSFLLVVQAQRYLESIDPKLEAMFWYDFQESLIYRSIASAAMWKHLSEKFPLTGAEHNFTQEERTIAKAKLENTSSLIVLSQTSEVLEQAKRSLNELGFDVSLVSTHEIKQGELTVKVNFIKIQKQKT